jgi:signal transduction histidine kinase
VLASHGPALESAHRRRLLGDMASQTDQLRRTIDALLDFSRFQSTRPGATIVAIGLDELLRPVLRATAAELAVEGAHRHATVLVDAALVRHALELLLAGTGTVETPPQLRAAVRDRHVQIGVHAAAETTSTPALVRSLASQLLVSAGAAFEDGPDPAVRLPRAEVEAVVS